jgi:hypothetical protein
MPQILYGNPAVICPTVLIRMIASYHGNVNIYTAAQNSGAEWDTTGHYVAGRAIVVLDMAFGAVYSTTPGTGAANAAVQTGTGWTTGDIIYIANAVIIGFGGTGGTGYTKATGQGIGGTAGGTGSDGLYMSWPVTLVPAGQHYGNGSNIAGAGSFSGGGGGGGGGANGTTAGGGGGGGGSGGNAGSAGGSSAGGTGGSGSYNNTGGSGGAGGFSGSAGGAGGSAGNVAGSNGTNEATATRGCGGGGGGGAGANGGSGGNNTANSSTGTAGGAAGYAIRKNGYTLTGTGTYYGTVG